VAGCSATGPPLKRASASPPARPSRCSSGTRAACARSWRAPASAPPPSPTPSCCCWTPADPQLAARSAFFLSRDCPCVYSPNKASSRPVALLPLCTNSPSMRTRDAAFPPVCKSGVVHVRYASIEGFSVQPKQGMSWREYLCGLHLSFCSYISRKCNYSNMQECISVHELQTTFVVSSYLYVNLQFSWRIPKFCWQIIQILHDLH